MHLNDSELVKFKKSFPSCYCHEIYRVETVGLKNSNYALKTTVFVDM